VTVDKTTYHAHLVLDPSGNWLAEVVEIPQVRTFGRTVGKAKEQLCHALAFWLHTHVLDIRVEFLPPRLPDTVQQTVDLVTSAREVAEAVARELSDLTAAAAVALVDDAHLSVREAAEVLNISHQRVHQIVSAVHAQQRAEELRRNLGAVQDEMEKQRGHSALRSPPGIPVGNEALLAIALVVVGGALLAAGASSK
jgi:predicted RNase H-like HicB family nuclease